MTSIPHRRTLLHFLALTLITASGLALGFDESPQTDPQPTNSVFDEKLDAIDRRTATIHDIDAEFEQRKYTTLLKKPIFSRGILKIKGNLARWDTQKPRRSTLLISSTYISIFYPQQALLEVYELDDKLRWLAISPAPRMGSLREKFVLTPASVDTFDQKMVPANAIGVRATPRDDAMRDHLIHIDILIDNDTALVVAVYITDADGDRTELIFSRMRTNTGLQEKDVTLSVPAGTKIVHPLGHQDDPQTQRMSGAP